MRLNGAVMPHQQDGAASPKLRGRSTVCESASTTRLSSDSLTVRPFHHKRVFGTKSKQQRWKGQHTEKYECKNKTKRDHETYKAHAPADTKLKDTNIKGNTVSMAPSLSSAGSMAESNNQKKYNNNYFMRVQQSFMALVHRFGPLGKKTKRGLQRPKSHPTHNNQPNHNHARATSSSYCGGLHTLPLYPLVAFTVLIVAVALPGSTRCDDGDNFFAVNSFNVIPETTTPEFDYASRGQKKFGDKCENTLECGFPGSICDPKKKSCQCTEDLPVTNHIDKCGKASAVNESCFFNEQCESQHFQTECRDSRCVCRFEMTPIWNKDGTVECKGRQDKKGPETYIDPAMIGVLVGMALMFIIICVVLRLFSQARWRENRTIFNTPNPRLMNVSLLRDSKLLHGQDRRGSRMSARGPSRQPSMVSLRPHSPNPSLGKTGRMIRSKSNTRSSDSRVSDVSNCSHLLEHPTTAHSAHPHVYTHSTPNATQQHNSLPPPTPTVGHHHNHHLHNYHHHHEQQQHQQPPTATASAQATVATASSATTYTSSPSGGKIIMPTTPPTVAVVKTNKF